MAERKQQGQQAQQAPQGTAMQEDAGLVALDPLQRLQSHVADLEVEVGKLTDEMNQQLGRMRHEYDQRLEALEQQDAPAPNLAGCLAALKEHRRARDGLLLWAKRTQGSSQGPLVAWVRQAMGLEEGR